MKSKEPHDHIIDLLCAPIDVSGYEELYQVLKKYFIHYKSVTHSAIVEIIEDSHKIYGEVSDLKLIFKLSKISGIPEDYSQHRVYLNEAETIVGIPIYFKNDHYDWIVLELKSKKNTDVLNYYFFKYLKNVNLYRDHKENVETLKVLASTDDVTGLYNQRKLAEDLESAVKLHEKEHEKFSIMFIDVDHFKNVNDDYGHLIGSKLLLDLGKALKLILRQSDHVYRYGGDEFVVIMPNVETKIVYEVATRILSQLKDHFFDIDNGDTYKMSLSIGIAEYPTDAKSAMDIIRFADEMMYKSKKSGRGKVFHVNEVANVDADTE